LRAKPHARGIWVRMEIIVYSSVFTVLVSSLATLLAIPTKDESVYGYEFGYLEYLSSNFLSVFIP